MLTCNRLQTLVLTDVYVVPDVWRNLVSISCLRNDYKILSNQGVVQITAYKEFCVATSMYHDLKKLASLRKLGLFSKISIEDFKLW